MTQTQYKEYQQHKYALKAVLEKIAALDMRVEWIDRFTKMEIYRNWRKLTEPKQKRLLAIAEVNSPSVAMIVDQKHTKIGTEMIEKIATVVTDERDRATILKHLTEKSWSDAKRDILLIIAKYEA